MHEHGPGDERDLPAAALDVGHHRRDARDADLDPPLRRDLVRHEREAQAVAFLKLRHRSHALHAAHDLVAGPHVAQLAAQGPAVLDDDDRIHPLALDFQPAAAVAHERLEVGRGIEIVRHAAVPVGLPDQRIARARDLAPERHELLEHALEPVLGRRRNPHRDRRRLVVGPPDRELQHFERRVPLDDGVEDHVQELRVDQMPFGLDDLAVDGVFSHVVSAGWAARAAVRRGSRGPRCRPARGSAQTTSRLRASPRTAGDPSGSAAAGRPLRR